MTPQPLEDGAVALSQASASVGVGSGIFARELVRAAVIAAMALLTLIDLFATQAILPSLAAHYGTTPAQTGLAVNATTLGMAIASLGIALFAARIDRRSGVVWSLCALAVPTALLAFAPSLPVFAALRVAQGLCMASAFALTLAYLGEHASRARRRRRFRRLHHRQCREQSDRPPRCGFLRRPLRPRQQLPRLRRPQSRRRGARGGDARARAANGESRRDRRSTARHLGPASRDAGPARRVRRRLLHSIRFRWHVQLRELRARPAADRARHDADRSRLSRLRAVDRDHCARRKTGDGSWAADRRRVRARPCRRRRGGAAHPFGRLGPRRTGAFRRWRLPRSGGDHRICQPRRAVGSRRRQRALSRRLFLPADSPAAPCWAPCSTCRDGQCAWPELSLHFSSPPRSRCSLSSASDRPGVDLTRSPRRRATAAHMKGFGCRP